MKRPRFLFILHSSVLILSISVMSVVYHVASAQSHVPARQRGRKASICGNPLTPCKTTATFKPNDLPFRVPANAVIIDTEPFYAIILKSVSVTNDDCDVFVPESERLQTQSVFPDHKVFTSRCTDPENLFYANVSEKHRIMAVYAGRTIAEAKGFLDTVKATGRFPGANIRPMRTGFNGT